MGHTALPSTSALDKLCARVPSKWESEFRSLVTTGVASEEFLAFMDADPTTQAAVEAALSEEMKNFGQALTTLAIDSDLVAAYVARKGKKRGKGLRDAAKFLTGLLGSPEFVRNVVASAPRENKPEVAQLINDLRDKLNPNSDSESNQSVSAAGR